MSSKGATKTYHRQVNLAGKKFGRLDVMCFHERKIVGDRTRPFWVCICECGNFCSYASNVLMAGNAVSCGCGKSKTMQRPRTHGMSKTKAYRSWNAMRTRCTNKNSQYYRLYGERGISNCPEWNKFENFVSDMGEPPTKYHSLDRIDVNGNYCKENCRWATQTEQARNNRKNRLITYRGKTQCVTAWEEELDLPNQLVSQRYWLGERDIERLFRRPELSNGKVRSGYVKQGKHE